MFTEQSRPPSPNAQAQQRRLQSLSSKERASESIERRVQLSVGPGALLYNNSSEGCLEWRGTMTLDDYMLTVFCAVDDQLPALHLNHLRQRGFAPLLHDSEGRTIDSWPGTP